MRKIPKTVTADEAVSVAIDNGFGAGYLASMINHMEAKS